uniref:Chromatin accessibility complex protein 1 n=1 Tax=Phallusia mammillata TaxID=59560 RepID=A0A6F9D948_9ASCI|nr:chromatin accessibility complex protein 1-like [Phallusia mammillata]
MEIKSPKQGSAISGLPLSRVKIIMKSSPDVDHISPDALQAMSKATEMFVSYLSMKAHDHANKRSIEYKNLADVVNNDDVFGFLQEVIPHKITVREYWKLRNSQQRSEDESSDDQGSGDG